MIQTMQRDDSVMLCVCERTTYMILRGATFEHVMESSKSVPRRSASPNMSSDLRSRVRSEDPHVQRIATTICC